MAEDALHGGSVRALERRQPLTGDVGRIPGVLRGLDDDQGVAGLEGVDLDGGSDGDALERCVAHPRPGREAPAEPDAEQGVGVPLGDDMDDLFDERAARRRADDEHLPAGLDADARVDEELGELTISGVSHAQQYKTYVLFCKVRSCRS